MEGKKQVRVGRGDLRETEKPTAVPRAMGKRIAAAGLWNRTAGSVREGIKVVMVANLCLV